MTDGPNFAGIAAAMGEKARARALCALMAGKALTATELANVADVTKQTMSVHLGKLLDSGLVSVVSQGRHRYFRIASPEVAQLVEQLMGLAASGAIPAPETGPRDTALRKARICYDHLAGELAVSFYESLFENGLAERGHQGIRLTTQGYRWLEGQGIHFDGARPGRELCRDCLDWSERRPHLAGRLGHLILEHAIQHGWARRARQGRAIHFSDIGEARLRALAKGLALP